MEKNSRMYELTMPAKEYRTPKWIYKSYAFMIALVLGCIKSLVLTHVLYGDISTTPTICLFFLTGVITAAIYMPFRHIACAFWDEENRD